MEEIKSLVVVEAEAKKELELAMVIAQEAEKFTITSK